MDQASVSNFLLLLCRCIFKQMMELILTSASHNSFLACFYESADAVGWQCFDTALGSSSISTITHLIALLNGSKILTDRESSFILCCLHFASPEKHHKHTLRPFPRCLQRLIVIHVSLLCLLSLYSIAGCSRGTFVHS